MDLTPDEQPVVCRAVAAYEAKKGHKGRFRGATADEILEELKPSVVRWSELAALVIETAEGTVGRNRYRRARAVGWHRGRAAGSQTEPSGPQ